MTPQNATFHVATPRVSIVKFSSCTCKQHMEPEDCPRTGGAQYVPTYRPTRKPSGECEDDETWEYLAGDKGYKRCDHVAKKPDPRCGRVSDDGVVASVACPETCGTCD